MYRKFLFITAVAAFAISSAQGIGYANEAQTHGGDIIYTQPLKSVTFSHKIHVEKSGLTCDLCHARLFKMEALAVQREPDFTMAGLAEGKWCGACHNGSMAFDSNSRCASCHSGVKGLPESKKEGHNKKH
jgi:c(7)-type cytochrome triheme protein